MNDLRLWEEGEKLIERGIKLVSEKIIQNFERLAQQGAEFPETITLSH